MELEQELSHLMQVRELKQFRNNIHHKVNMSHLMQVRELKPQQHFSALVSLYVAPHAGAWIET